MPERTFRKHERLLEWPEFQQVMNRGRRKRVETLCTVFWLPNRLGYRRFGVVASRKIGNAVVRNRTKRRLREIFRNHKERFAPESDIVVLSGRGMNDLPFPALERKILDALAP